MTMPRKARPKRSPGRPTKLNAVTQRRICDLIRKGVPRERAARLSGIGASTFHEWMRKGDAGEAGYAEFPEAIRNAEDALVQKAVSVVVSLLGPGTKGNRVEPSVRLNAAKFILSHKFPGDFSSRQDVRHEGKDGGPIEVRASVEVQSVITPEAAAAMTLDQLEAATRGAIEGDEAEED